MHGHACPPGWWCVDTGRNPNYGFTSFDDILSAWLSIFQCVTMTNWTDVMYQMQDSLSQLSFIYFILLVLLTAYFAMNLAVAVLVTTFRAVRSRGRRPCVAMPEAGCIRVSCVCQLARIVAHPESPAAANRAADY